MVTDNGRHMFDAYAGKVPCLMFYVYALLVFFKYVYQFNDGLIDIAVLGVAVTAIAIRPRKVMRLLAELLKERVTIVWLLFTFYYVILSLYSYNSIDNIIIEYFSVFKWVIYFMVGYLLIGVYRAQGVIYPRLIDMTLFVTIVLVFSLYNYNWDGLEGELLGYYDNSFGSIFSLRSVFALFALIVMVYALNFVRDVFLKYFFLFSSFIFIFLSGTRKMVIAVLLLILFLKVQKKYKHIWRALSYSFVIFVAFLLLNLDLFERTISEYSNPYQPRNLAYAVSFQIASDYFPFGSGPATFASRGSMINYSPIYGQYGLNNQWGFRDTDRIHFYNDTYWAQIIGQYGVVGLILVLALLASIWGSIGGDDNRINNRLLLSVVLILSLTTPSLQRTEIALFVFFTFGMYVRLRNEYQ